MFLVVVELAVIFSCVNRRRNWSWIDGRWSNRFLSKSGIWEESDTEKSSVTSAKNTEMPRRHFWDWIWTHSFFLFFRSFLLSLDVFFRLGASMPLIEKQHRFFRSAGVLRDLNTKCPFHTLWARAHNKVGLTCLSLGPFWMGVQTMGKTHFVLNPKQKKKIQFHFTN